MRTLLESIVGIVVAALIVGFLALSFAYGAEPHSHWALAIEREDGAGRVINFEDEATCKAAQEHITTHLEEVTLMSECIEMPLYQIKRAPAALQGEKT